MADAHEESHGFSIEDFLIGNWIAILLCILIIFVYFLYVTYSFDIVHAALLAIGYLLPIPLARYALTLWHHYRQEQYMLGLNFVLLEIQVPREVIKSPAAMELIFSNAFYHQTGRGFWDEYIIGEVWPFFSLEIASIDGEVHFYVRTPTAMRNLVETQIYAQYPQAKVIEVPDYALNVPGYTKNGDWEIWGAEFNKIKADFLPIKTYRGFGDDLKTGVKEEFKIDPLTPTIEYMGSLPKGQQLWMQIMIKWSDKKYHSHHTGAHLEFPDAAHEFMIDLLKPYSRAQKDEVHSNQIGTEVRTPENLRPVVKAITDQVNQIHFDCGIRLMTLSDKRLCSPEQFTNLKRDARLLFRQFAQPGINELIRINSTQFDYAWSDPTGTTLTKWKKRTLDWYRLRMMFYPPLQLSSRGKPQPFVLSAEELATLYHFPGMVSGTPSFKRIESKIAKPPANLPI